MSRWVTAQGAGLLSCHTCGQLCRAGGAPRPRCPRCRAPLHDRKPASVATTWALTLAALVLFVPANTLPMMTTSSLAGTQSDTILSGVVFLWTSGSWPLALVVFFASILVPLLKIMALLYLTLSVQLGAHHAPRARTKLYRLVEFIGRWSMLDIYVVTLLVALVRFQGLATVDAGPAALAFGAVVVLTLFAAMSFDPRLIWDPLSASDEAPDD